VADLKFYNTLTRTKEAFAPIDDKNVRMYVCGPTVYDFAHIGNARPAIVFDVLFRLLRHVYGEEHVTYVRNITDVDDKINTRALRDFGDKIASGDMTLNEAIRHVTEKTATQYHADVKALGCLEPTFEPRATEFVLPRADGKSDMVTIIQSLLDKGHAYVAIGGEGREVLFDVTSMSNYGGLSNRKLEDQQAGARIAVESHKKNPGDFVLWKESDADQPGWDGTFSVGGETVSIHGRPGWHIECSAMSAAYLGETFDIHGGGLDLIFPHHENEIAQSCCAHNTDKMANIWMHNGYLQVEGKKMSKSDGNFVTIHDLLNTEKFGGRKWSGEVLRLAMLMTHYREPIDFSVRRLEEAERIINGWLFEIELSPMAFIEQNRSYYENFAPTKELINSLLDDVSFSVSLSVLHKLSKSSQVMSKHELFACLRFLGIFDFEAMRIVMENRKAQLIADSESSLIEVDTGAIDKQITQRLTLLADKKFAEADKIRDDLLAQGIQLKDSKDSETGERITTWEVKR
jgi:cysteinyl-tRNA synthetase